MNMAPLRDFFFIGLTRGSGFLITASMLFGNSLTRGSAAYAQIGQDLALATLVIGPPLGILAQIQIRRVTANGDLARYLTPGKIVSACSLASILITQLLPREIHVFGISLKAVMEAVSFVFCQSVLVSQLLLASLTSHVRLQLAIICTMCAAVAVFTILRISGTFQMFEGDITLECIVLWFAGLIALSCAHRVKPRALVNPVYPMSTVTISKYMVSTIFFSGLFVLDWRLLHALLQPADFAGVSYLRVTLERFLMPILATSASALLVGSYRGQASGAASKPSGDQALGRRFQTAYLPAILLSAAVLLALYSRNIAWGILPLGYLAAGAVSFYIDLFQAKYSLPVVAALAVGYFGLYGLVSWLAIHNFGTAGHAFAWFICNSALAFMLAKSLSLSPLPSKR